MKPNDLDIVWRLELRPIEGFYWGRWFSTTGEVSLLRVYSEGGQLRVGRRVCGRDMSYDFCSFAKRTYGAVVFCGPDLAPPVNRVFNQWGDDVSKK